MGCVARKNRRDHEDGTRTHKFACFDILKTLQERQMPTLGQCREKLAQEVRLQVLWLDDKEWHTPRMKEVHSFKAGLNNGAGLTMCRNVLG